MGRKKKKKKQIWKIRGLFFHSTFFELSFFLEYTRNVRRKAPRWAQFQFYIENRAFNTVIVLTCSVLSADTHMLDNNFDKRAFFSFCS